VEEQSIRLRTVYQPSHSWGSGVHWGLLPMGFSQTEPGDHARCNERCCTIDRRGCYDRGVSGSIS